MKKLTFSLLLFLCTIGCNRRDLTDVMTGTEAQSIVDDISERNKAYQPLTERDDTMMQRVVAYYREHGTRNELMEAYYLLGSVYRDLHEAPKAMEAFLNGISVADTTDRHCRYDILARLYAQESDIYYLQNLYNQSIQAEKMVYKYAVLAEDSLFMVAAQWGRLGKCYAFGDYETIADECWSILMESKQLGLYSYGVGYLCTCVLANVELGRFDEAEKLLSIFELHSGNVDMATHECSFPIYYYAKGRVLAAAGQLDSAEFFYRKELVAKDWNNRQAAYRGLRLVFEQKGKADSLAKYAALQCDAVDSSYQEMLSRNLQNLHELYDYSRAQEDSYNKSLLLEKERRVRQRMWWSAAVVIVLLMLVTYYFRARYLQKVSAAELDLERANAELMEREAELGWLRKQMEELTDEIQRKEFAKGIEDAERGVEEQRDVVVEKEEVLENLRYRSIAKSKSGSMRRQYRNEPVFEQLYLCIKKGQKAKDDDFEEVKKLLQRNDASLLRRMYALVPQLTEAELHVFLLMRMGMTKTQVSALICHERSAVSNIINRLYKKANGHHSCSSAEADDWLLSI